MADVLYPLSDDDRARLIKTGNWGVNHLEKSIVIYNETLKAGKNVVYKILKIKIDIQHLMTVGVVLEAQYDGNARKFLAGAESALKLPMFKDAQLNIMETVILLVNFWGRRDKLGPSKFFEEMAGTDLYGEIVERSATPPYSITMPIPEELLHLRRYCEFWGDEEFFEKELTPQEKNVKQNCTFCGARSYPGVALMACGGCLQTFYCDRCCQKAHWKKGHKVVCQAWVKVENERQEREATLPYGEEVD